MESRKKGIALYTITALVAMKPTTRTELAIAGCITIIAIVAIIMQWSLDKEKKDVQKNIDVNVPAGG